MKKGQKTIREAFKAAGLSDDTGALVNDLFARHGAETVQVGRKKLTVQKPRKK